MYTQLGFNETDLADFFTGPAYLPWNRMGNVYNWQGPLSQNWINSQKALQLQILAYMRAIGMTPVLPAFAGHVPYSAWLAESILSLSLYLWRNLLCVCVCCVYVVCCCTTERKSYGP